MRRVVLPTRIQWPLWTRDEQKPAVYLEATQPASTMAARLASCLRSAAIAATQASQAVKYTHS